MAKDLMKCDHCGKNVDSTTTGTCMTSHVNLDDFGARDKDACPDDYFYCQDCLNEFSICPRCDKILPKESQKEISDSY